MWYDPKIIKYPVNSESGIPSQEDLLKIMEEIPSYKYTALCDYLAEVIRRDETINIENLEDKYYRRPVNTSKDANYLMSYFFLAYYYYKHDLYPCTAMDYLHLALLEQSSYDSASALLALFYMEGFGVKENMDKAKEIIFRARKEIDSWPMKYDIFHLSVYQFEL